MNCDIDYCIYNKNFKCMLDEISINAYGMCEECLRITVDEAVLEQLKKELRLKKM